MTAAGACSEPDRIEQAASHSSDYGTPITHTGPRQDCKVCPPTVPVHRAPDPAP